MGNNRFDWVMAVLCVLAIVAGVMERGLFGGVWPFNCLVWVLIARARGNNG